MKRSFSPKVKQLEHQTEEKLRDIKGHEHLHHILTVAVTLLHVAVAIVTIAVEKKERMTAKSVAPSSERNRPEIF